MIKISFCLVAALLLLSACSFHSSQWDALQETFSEDESSLADVVWKANWNGSDYLLYAVSAQEETIFAYDRRIRVHFNGWNITEVVGVLASEASLTIEEQGKELLYFMDNRLMARHSCEPWQQEELIDLGELRYFQECSGREKYRNRIDVSSEGNITRLEFLIHPEYPSILLTPSAFGD